MVVELKTVVPFGRSLEEYRMMFELSEQDLEKNIVGVSDGVSSFNTEMNAAGKRVLSIDPIYEESGEFIQSAFNNSIENVIQQLGSTSGDYIWSYYKNLDVYRDIRTATIKRFLKDFETGISDGRYVLGELPSLKYADKSFDLALHANLLFLYSDLFDYEFHLQSVKELSRIAREVRIYPLMDISNKRSWHVEPIVADLNSSGYNVEVRVIEYEFMKGSNEILVVKSEV